MDSQYISSTLGDPYVPSVTSRALPTSKRAILLERGSNNRDSTVSSSMRLPTSIGGLWGLLGKHFGIPGLLLGRSQESAESRLGFLLHSIYFLCGFVNVPKRIGAIAFSNTNDQMERSVL